MNQLSITLTRIIPIALGLIGAVEKISGALSGKKKKEAYVEGMMAALGIAETTLNRDILDDEKFRTLVGNVADSVITVSNFIRDFRAKETK